MRSFEISGPVYPEDNYIVERTEALSDFVNRLERGRFERFIQERPSSG